MLNYSVLCSCSKNLSSFWLLKQQWTIEEISIFSNSSHLKWRAGLSITNLKGTHPRTISARFGLFWFRGFREEDLNVKVYDIRRTDERTTMDAKWWQKLTWSLARWANKTDRHDIVESGIKHHRPNHKNVNVKNWFPVHMVTIHPLNIQWSFTMYVIRCLVFEKIF